MHHRSYPMILSNIWLSEFGRIWGHLWPAGCWGMSQSHFLMNLTNEVMLLVPDPDALRQLSFRSTFLGRRHEQQTKRVFLFWVFPQCLVHYRIFGKLLNNNYQSLWLCWCLVLQLSLDWNSISWGILRMLNLFSPKEKALVLK